MGAVPRWFGVVHRVEAGLRPVLIESVPSTTWAAQLTAQTRPSCGPFSHWRQHAGSCAAVAKGSGCAYAACEVQQKALLGCAHALLTTRGATADAARRSSSGAHGDQTTNLRLGRRWRYSAARLRGRRPKGVHPPISFLCCLTPRTYPPARHHAMSTHTMTRMKWRSMPEGVAPRALAGPAVPPSLRAPPARPPSFSRPPPLTRRAGRTRPY